MELAMLGLLAPSTVVALLANLLRVLPVYPYAEPLARLVLEKVLVLSKRGPGTDIGNAGWLLGGLPGECASGTR